MNEKKNVSFETEFIKYHSILRMILKENHYDKESCKAHKWCKCFLVLTSVSKLAIATIKHSKNIIP